MSRYWRYNSRGQGRRVGKRCEIDSWGLMSLQPLGWMKWPGNWHKEKRPSFRGLADMEQPGKWASEEVIYKLGGEIKKDKWGWPCLSWVVPLWKVQKLFGLSGNVCISDCAFQMKRYEAQVSGQSSGGDCHIGHCMTVVTAVLCSDNLLDVIIKHEEED